MKENAYTNFLNRKIKEYKELSEETEKKDHNVKLYFEGKRESYEDALYIYLAFKKLK